MKILRIPNPVIKPKIRIHNLKSIAFNKASPIKEKNIIILKSYDSFLTCSKNI